MIDLDVDAWGRLVESAEPPTVERVASELADRFDIGIEKARSKVEAELDSDGPVTFDPDAGTFGAIVVQEGNDGDEEPDIRDANPTPDPSEEGENSDGNDVSREAAVAALRDVLKFYNRRVDETIQDHTDDGEHPERPTTAREYFTQERGWDSDTVDDLLLGWAPPDHADRLVAYLHEQGHSRDAMLATGVIGETDTGGFYTTFAGRYVLPYYDANGDPAYAIARCTGGDGGGAKGYGGHPRDYQAGKYAKLRHTDERVPFAEPIYGLDTLAEGEHVVIAEGIADAITARERGYAVLSPVAKEFKKDHYEPLVDALAKHDVERVTIVADADSIRNGDASEHDPETIADAVSTTLSPVGAGLAGALRTADTLQERADAGVRVALPPAPADVVNDLDEFVTGAWNGDLSALLRSARPPSAYPELDSVVSDEPADAFDDFDAEEYEPDATSADETATDIRDIFSALGRLDAKRVAERTIVSEWLESSGRKRAFAPTWAPAGYDGTANFVDDDKWMDTGTRGGYGGPAAMAAIDAGLVRDTQCPRAVEGETWWEAVEHLRDLGFDIPELADTESQPDDVADRAQDLLSEKAVVEPAMAIAAARAVEPDDIDKPLPELERDDVDDVAIAVALSQGYISDPDQYPSDGRYTESYYRARDHYGAPLPKYLDNSTLEQRADLVFAALERLNATHILDSCESEITVDDPDSAAFAKLDPTWEDSESGERILAGYGRGFYCVEHDTSFSPLQLAALEHDLIETEDDYPRGEAFKQAYRLLREDYGAPLPKWRATLLEHVAVLPSAARVVGDNSTQRSLSDAHDATEELIRDATSVRDHAQLVTCVPGTGKTFSTIKQADDTPVLYLAGRNELKKQAEEYAVEAGVSSYHLPIFAEAQFQDAVINDAVAAVRDRGTDLLRNRSELRAAVDTPIEADDEDDEESVDLNRATCRTADREFGIEWALAVQTARALGHDPADIHRYDTALFGEELPCHEDDHDCPYTRAWDEVRNPDTQADVLIGAPGHAYVDSATTYFDRDQDGDRVERTRAVALDEFPGDQYVSEYGDRYLDHATWLAESLVDIDTREDVLGANLNERKWVTLWLDGDGDDFAAAADLTELLYHGKDICDARSAAEDLLDSGGVTLNDDLNTAADIDALRDALQALVAGAPTDGDLSDMQDTISSVAVSIEDDADRMWGRSDKSAATALYDVLDALEDVTEPLASACAAGERSDLPTAVESAAGDLPIGGDLADILDDCVAVLRGDDEREGLLDAAITALEGGRDGCQQLAIYGGGGYAHPDAWALLASAIADDVPEVTTETFAFDDVDGGRFKRFDQNGATIVGDKDHHGALVTDPPAFTNINGTKCPVLGLDATGRTELWRLAIGRDTQRRDIHETDVERRAFLRDVMHLRVVQTSSDPLPYHGSPEGKNFGEDLELVRAVAEKYTGIGPDVVDDAKPAVISTLKVLNHLETDLEEHVSETVNYENMKGSDALGERQVAVILGSQHYGDAKPEKWGLLAGEDTGRGDTRGDTLDYGSDVANAYLKNMREDHTMQAVLRAGRNDDATVVFAHTNALRDDLPVDDEGAVLSAHSKGTLAVAEAASEFAEQPFTVTDIVEAIGDDTRAVGRRQVQNVLADLRESGYLRVREEGGPGVAYEYELEDDPGLADVDIPEPEPAGTAPGPTNENSRSSTQYTWNFVSQDPDQGQNGILAATRATIPASEAIDTDGPPPDIAT